MAENINRIVAWQLYIMAWNLLFGNEKPFREYFSPASLSIVELYSWRLNFVDDDGSNETIFYGRCFIR